MKRTTIIITALLLAIALCGCSISSGTFFNCTKSFNKTGFSASYGGFNGSMSKVVSFDKGDTLTFSYQGDDGLAATISKGKDSTVITDGTTYEIPSDGVYKIRVKGNAKDGSFKISWTID